MSSGFDTIIFQNHGINLHKLNLERNWSVTYGGPPEYIRPEAYLTAFGWYDEEPTYFRDTESGDLLIVNNFYDGSPRNQVPDPTYLSTVERAAEGLAWLERVAFPGSFSWKFVSFERMRHLRTTCSIGPRVTLHRGSCFCIRFRFRGDWSKRMDSKRLHGKRARSQPLNEAESRFATEYYRRTKDEHHRRSRY